MNLALGASLFERLPMYRLQMRVTSFVTVKVNDTSHDFVLTLKTLLFSKELASANDFPHMDRVYSLVNLHFI